ncbi:hypothetical protein DFJ63DRAFT_327176 [Scheffersomyces coipomensis]|uniref:uncharacterized protein n=1 Tax=Scheffersomyces coipomensis TaxID=1788519 RepID=UPI00315D889C
MSSSDIPTTPSYDEAKLKQELENVKKDVEGVANETIEELKKDGESLKKQLKEFEKEGEDFIAKLFESFKRFGTQSKDTLYSFVTKATETSSTALSKTAVEFQNPVVIAQTVIGITGIAAGYAAYLERHRINTDNKLVVSIHASIITGLVLLDGYLFTTYYPKYDKKKL